MSTRVPICPSLLFPEQVFLISYLIYKLFLENEFNDLNLIQRFFCPENFFVFNSVLSYELICDESTKIHVIIVVFLQFQRLISIDSKFQCEHNFN